MGDQTKAVDHVGGKQNVAEREGGKGCAATESYSS